jgi:hypothetical protein
MEELACTLLLTMAILIAFKLFFLLFNPALLLFLGNHIFHSEDWLRFPFHSSSSSSSSR